MVSAEIRSFMVDFLVSNLISNPFRTHYQCRLEMQRCRAMIMLFCLGISATADLAIRTISHECSISDGRRGHRCLVRSSFDFEYSYRRIGVSKFCRFNIMIVSTFELLQVYFAHGLQCVQESPWIF